MRFTDVRHAANDLTNLSDAIHRAERARRQALNYAAEMEQNTEARLLITDDTVMEAARREAATARRAADRIEALLEQMRDMTRRPDFIA